MNLVPFSKIATRNNRRDSHREVEKNLPIFRRRRIRWWEEGWREGTVRVGLTRFKRPPPTYPRYCSGTCDHERYACVGAGSFIYRGSVLAGCNLYKCWDPLDLSALRYPLITTLCPPSSSLSPSILPPSLPPPRPNSHNSSPRARYISTLQSAGLGYKLRS